MPTPALARQFQEWTQKGTPASVLAKGHEPYLERELRACFKKGDVEFDRRELKKTGPDGSVEESGAGLSLFGTRKILWLAATSPVSQWSAEAKTVWSRLLSQADGDSLSVILHVDADKRFKWDSLGRFDATLEFAARPEESLGWLEKMNAARGSRLDAERLRFLASDETDLSILENRVELWSVGGDLWAERSLGWFAGARGSGKAHDTANPGFAWCDAVLAGQSTEALRRLKALLDDGEEPLQLLGLLGKSVRILATLDSGRSPVGQPEFLVGKLRRLGARPGYGKRLLARVAEVDRLLKTSGVKPFAAMSRLLTP